MGDALVAFRIRDSNHCQQIDPKCGLESPVAPPLESEMGGYNSQLGLERGLKSLVTVLVVTLVASSNRPFSWIARPVRGSPGRQTVLAGTHDELGGVAATR